MASLIVVVCIASAPAPAPAVACDAGATCNATYCEVACSSDAEYIIIGRLWNGSWQGVGVCVFNTDAYYSQGTFVERQGFGTDSADYRLFAGSGNDLVRLASTTGESCGSGWTIYGQLDDSTDTFMIWGDAGNDRIYLCDAAGSSEPASSSCITKAAGQNAGRADGRGGSDYVYGSPYIEELWGEAGDDRLYGHSGSDTLHGGTDEDDLYGGAGCDAIYGDAGTDDYCNCGSATREGDAYDCETVDNCPGCFDRLPDPDTLAALEDTPLMSCGGYGADPTGGGRAQVGSKACERWSPAE